MAIKNRGYFNTSGVTLATKIEYIMWVGECTLWVGTQGRAVGLQMDRSFWLECFAAFFEDQFFKHSDDPLLGFWHRTCLQQ